MAVTRADGVHFDAKLAGADLSEKVGYFAHYDTDGDIVLAGNAEQVAGIITEAAVEGKPVTFQTGGLGKAIAGAQIVAGERVMSNGDGKAIPMTGASAHGVGTARSGASGDGVWVEIEIDRTRGAA